MNPIKFRAWFKDGGLDGKGCMTLLNNEEIDVCLDEGAPVMQYTGVNDKDGKDIYEGDIVLTPQHPYINIWFIEFRDGAYLIDNGINSCEAICSDSIGYVTIGKTWAMDIKVIGNIYQNPDLIEIRS